MGSLDYFLFLPYGWCDSAICVAVSVGCHRLKFMFTYLSFAMLPMALFRISFNCLADLSNS